MADEKKKTTKARQSGKPCKQRYNSERRWNGNKNRRRLRKLRHMKLTPKVMREIEQITGTVHVVNSATRKLTKLTNGVSQ